MRKKTKGKWNGRPKGVKNKPSGIEGQARKLSAGEIVKKVIREAEDGELTPDYLGVALYDEFVRNKWLILNRDGDINRRAHMKAQLRMEHILEYFQEVSLTPEGDPDTEMSYWFNTWEHVKIEAGSGVPSKIAQWAFEKGYIPAAKSTGRPHLSFTYILRDIKWLCRHTHPALGIGKTFIEIDTPDLEIKQTWRYRINRCLNMSRAVKDATLALNPFNFRNSAEEETPDDIGGGG